DGKISTINQAAAGILNIAPEKGLGAGLDGIVKKENLTVLQRVIQRAARIGHASEQTTLDGERNGAGGETIAEIPVALTATALPADSGVVLVIEDLSELIAAQRASAWQEVARRMAHEIKNPLTPIQLSAERIAKRFRESEVEVTAAPASAKSAGIADSIRHSQTSKVVHEGTDTILREVQSLKAMVDEFSRFARLPNARLEICDIYRVVEQAAALYADRADDAKLIIELGTAMPQIMADPEQLKRVFVNLIENSIEAFDSDEPERSIRITTRYDIARDIVVAEVADNGGGVDPADLQKIFQPHFSTKGRGTGLGLAIVKRIVTEHQGKIKVVGNQPKGAKFIIEIPAIS
ncbi:MAG TPA: ATP-binding protein, partial [Pyrinomonadaceae bacterium]|nr:ATP-binding protein [Pyrinomonadaceae bacterium]